MRKRDNYNNYMKQYMLRRYRERRNLAISLLGGECEVCGTTTNLEIDHIRPNTKKFTVLGSRWSCSLDVFLKEVNKCQLLCGDCHISKTIDDFHGKRIWKP